MVLWRDFRQVEGIVDENLAGAVEVAQIGIGSCMNNWNRGLHELRNAICISRFFAMQYRWHICMLVYSTDIQLCNATFPW